MYRSTLTVLYDWDNANSYRPLKHLTYSEWIFREQERISLAGRITVVETRGDEIRLKVNKFLFKPYCVCPDCTKFWANNPDVVLEGKLK